MYQATPAPFSDEDLTLWRKSIEGARKLRNDKAEAYGWQENIDRYRPKSVKDAEGKVTRAAGAQLASFAEMRDDGTTDGGCWIYTGVYGPSGNFALRRDNADPSGLGVHGNWGFAWPANRRVLYNRASADPEGKPWSEAKKYMAWNGERWGGPDVPDFPPTKKPDAPAKPAARKAAGK